MYIKNKLIITSLGLALCFGLFGQNNLVQNGGFEKGISENWTTDAGTGTLVTYSLNTTDAIEGLNCLQAEVTTLGASPWNVQIKNAFGPVVEGKLYRTTIWAKAATGGSTVNYTIGKATAGYDEYASTYGLELTTEWAKYTHEFIAQVSTIDDITLAMHITGTDTYWFDDYSVVEVTDDVSSAEINENGNRVEIAFIMNLASLTPEDQLPFFVSSTETSYTVSGVKEGSTSNALVLELEDPVVAGETISVEYIPGTLRSSAGVEIQGFIFEAENNSTHTPSALSGNNTQNFEIYPNPVTNLISISSENDVLISSIKILDLGGRIVDIIDTGMETNSIRIDLSHIQKGTYLLLIEDSENTVSVSKIIKN